MAHTECPDCGTTLRGIKLTDATERFWSEGTSRVDQQYAARDFPILHRQANRLPSRMRDTPTVLICKTSEVNNIR